MPFLLKGKPSEYYYFILIKCLRIQYQILSPWRNYRGVHTRSDQVNTFFPVTRKGSCILFWIILYYQPQNRFKLKLPARKNNPHQSKQHLIIVAAIRIAWVKAEYQVVSLSANW